jgi:hypothetical protein
MKKLALISTSFVLLLGLSSQAYAQTISFGANQPVGGKGQISGSGTFDCGCGNTGYQIQMIAVGPIGGQPKSYPGTFDPKNAQSGSWNVTIPNLPVGTYNVSVRLYYQIGGMGTVFKTNPVNGANNPYTVN